MGSAFGLTPHSLLGGVGCLDVLIDLPTPSSHVPHHRPSLWYIVWGKIGGVQLVMG